jgi:hypothetical protein
MKNFSYYLLYFFICLVSALILFIILVSFFYAQIPDIPKEKTWILKANSWEYKKNLARKLGGSDLLPYIIPQNILPTEMRDDPVALKPEKVPQILILGDSVGYGFNLPKRQVFSTLLRKKLPAYRIYNYCAKGQNIFQIHTMFLDLLTRSQPKMIIYVLCDNDIYPTYLARNKSLFKRYGSFTYPGYAFKVKNGHLKLRSVLPMNVYRYCFDQFSIMRFYVLEVQRWYKHPKEERPDRFFYRNYNVLLQDMYKRCRSENIRFIIVWPKNTAKNKENPRFLSKLIRKWAGEKIIMEFPSNYFRDPIHLNYQGQIALANGVFHYLRTNAMPGPKRHSHK